MYYLQSVDGKAIRQLVEQDNVELIWDAFDGCLARLVEYHDATGTLLHYAVLYRPESSDLFIKLAELGIPIDWCNSQDGDTVLHLACRAQLLSTVGYLMQRPNSGERDQATQLTRANFSIANKRGEYALDLLQSNVWRKRIPCYSQRMCTLVYENGSNETVKAFITRNQQLLDLQWKDAKSGQSILQHYKNVGNHEMVKFLTSLKGPVIEQQARVTEQPRPELFSANPRQSDRVSVPSGQFVMNAAIEHQGYLEKWTNYASGYRKRWFVLHNAILSYYKNQWEYPARCRGSMLLKHVKISKTAGDRRRFTITNGTSQKMHLRASDEQEAMQWIFLLEQAKSTAEEGGPSASGEPKPAAVRLETRGEFDYAKLDAAINAVRQMEAELFARTRDDEVDQQLHAIHEALALAKQMQSYLESVCASSEEEVGEAEPLEHEESSEEEEEEFFDAFATTPSLALREEQPLLPKPLGYSAQLIRMTLPFRSCDIPRVSLWSFLRGVIGKDLTKLPVPVNYNEPLSMLQRMAEDMQYTSLLTKAARFTDSWQRLQFVAAFAVSAYASTEERMSKPFNPLLGETFEFYHEQEGYWYFSEQVSHHPPISACYSDGPVFRYWNESFVKSTFRGRSLDVIPEGTCHLFLKETGEHYSWKKPRSSVQNILFGKMFIEHSGTMHVINHTTKESCLIEFKPNSSSCKRSRSFGQFREKYGDETANANNTQMGGMPKCTPEKRIEGHVLSATGDVLDELEGYWNSHLVSKSIGQLWSSDQQRFSDYYNFSPFTMMLNAIDEKLVRNLPSTDSRLRPDQRALEIGDIEQAQSLKARLEQRQRDRKKQGIGQHARWFENVPGNPLFSPSDSVTDPGTTGNHMHSHWRYLGGYWEGRAEGFHGLLDIFHTAPDS